MRPLLLQPKPDGTALPKRHEDASAVLITIPASSTVATTSLKPAPKPLEGLLNATPGPGPILPAPLLPRVVSWMLGPRPAGQPIRDEAFVGDSQLVGTLKDGGLHRRLHRSCSTDARWGRSLAAFEQQLRTLPRDSLLEKKGINLFFGGNDISSGKSADTIIQRFRTVLAKLRELAPSAEIRIADIPWRWDALREPPEWLAELRDEHGWTACERQATLEAVNAWIADECEGFERIPVNDWIGDYNSQVRCSSVASGADDNDVALPFKTHQPDVHLATSGYILIAGKISALLSR